MYLTVQRASAVRRYQAIIVPNASYIPQPKSFYQYKLQAKKFFERERMLPSRIPLSDFMAISKGILAYFFISIMGHNDK